MGVFLLGMAVVMAVVMAVTMAYCMVVGIVAGFSVIKEQKEKKPILKVFAVLYIPALIIGFIWCWIDWIF